MLGALAVLFVAAFLALRFAVYSPATIVPGENLCLIGYYRLDEQGLDGFKDLIERSRGMTEEYTVAFFEAELDEHGAVKTFALSLDTFENGDYAGVAVYSYADRSLTYDPPAQNGSSLVNTPNPNSTLDYLSEQLKRIPLADQISASGLERFVLQYRPHTLIDENTPIFDGRGKDSFPILDAARYNAGEGGTSDGNTNVVFRLYNGWSTVEGQQYLYVFDPLEPETAEGDPVAIMQCDYAISGGTLEFTKTHGQRWIESDLTETELAETLDFYRSGLYLPPASVFISPDDSLPIAYFYGGAPTLKLTFDEGETWSTVPLAGGIRAGSHQTRDRVRFAAIRLCGSGNRLVDGRWRAQDVLLHFRRRTNMEREGASSHHDKQYARRYGHGRRAAGSRRLELGARRVLPLAVRHRRYRRYVEQHRTSL